MLKSTNQILKNIRKMGRHKQSKILINNNIRDYNLYRGILQVALIRDCDLSSVRNEIIEAAGITLGWLSLIERTGLKNVMRVNITSEIQAAIESYMTQQLGFDWKLEKRKIDAVEWVKRGRELGLVASPTGLAS